MDKPLENPNLPEPSNALGPLAGYERHSLGRFGEKVIRYLGSGDSFGKVGDDDIFIVVDSIELGDYPFAEEIRIKFHLSRSPSSPDYVPHWGAFPPSRPVVHHLSPGMKPDYGIPRLFFTFSSAIPFEENIQEFVEFVEEEKANTVVAPPVTAVGTDTLPRDAPETPHDAPETPHEEEVMLRGAKEAGEILAEFEKRHGEPVPKTLEEIAERIRRKNRPAVG